MKYDCIVIGGGFYGCMLALELRQKFKKILIFEKENDILTRASLINQARIHGGYHYPRSLVTAFRSLNNFSRFCKDFPSAVKKDFDKYYAISKVGSKTNAAQFYQIFKKMNAYIEEVSSGVYELFNKDMIEKIFCVKEYVFDAVVLREILQEKMKKVGCEILLGVEVESIERKEDVIRVKTNMESFLSENGFNCAYAGINKILKNSNLPFLNLKSEITEMALIEIPKELENLSITIMDGEFFSIMPYPAYSYFKCLNTLSHVRYTPHAYWHDVECFHDGYLELEHYHKKTNFSYMLKSAMRFIPLLQQCKYVDSLFEVKVVSAYNENDDGRPIIFANNYGIQNFSNILGGKIDNIYDILEILRSSDEIL